MKFSAGGFLAVYKVEVNEKFTLEQVMKAQSGSRDTVLLFL